MPGFPFEPGGRRFEPVRARNKYVIKTTIWIVSNSKKLTLGEHLENSQEIEEVHRYRKIKEHFGAEQDLDFENQLKTLSLRNQCGTVAEPERQPSIK